MGPSPPRLAEHTAIAGRIASGDWDGLPPVGRAVAALFAGRIGLPVPPRRRSAVVAEFGPLAAAIETQVRKLLSAQGR